jgi:dTDP-4-dehydrorhamnose reductase
MKKKILITGGSGLLAINWAMIVRNDFNVVLGLHNRTIKIDGVHSEKISMESIEHLQADLTRIMPHIVINTAANTSVEECEASFKIAKNVNTVTASNISHVCENLKIKLVHISSDHIFSGKDQFYEEECQPCALNNYAKTKLNAEKNVSINNPSSLIIRTNFFGWGSDYRKSFSDFIINSLRNNIAVNLYKDVFYTPIIIDELVLCIHNLLNLNEFGIFNIVGNERISKHEFGLKVATCFDLNLSLIKPITYDEKLNLVLRPKDMSLSNKKLIKVLQREIPSIDDQLFFLRKQEKYRVSSLK